MLKILKKIKFDDKENRMSKVAATEDVVKNYKKGKNKNLDYLLSKRYGWMNNFIAINDHGVELGSGAGFAKHFINCKNFKISDFSNIFDSAWCVFNIVGWSQPQYFKQLVWRFNIFMCRNFICCLYSSEQGMENYNT